MTAMVTGEDIDAFRQEVWDFYREHARSLPWRETQEPYAVLVSELMLQQTQVPRVIPKYEAWMERFPDAHHLAQASLAEVLTLWNGLGYNRRAVYLQKAVQEVCGRYGGVFPRSEAELCTLPGVGPYTAGAVCAFAFDMPVVFVETNIRSVFIHYFFTGADKKIDDRDILPLVRLTLDEERPRAWYYALMDLGAELKRTLPNPSRKSNQYAKQSRFEGSFRQVRGAILRQLAEVGNASRTLSEIAVAEGIDVNRIRAAAETLVREGILVQIGESVRIKD